MNRRNFIKGTTTGAAIAAVGPVALGQTKTDRPAAMPDRFTLDYAPHFGMFTNHAGDDEPAQEGHQGRTHATHATRALASSR